MAQEDYVLNGSYKFVPERGEYIAIISKIGRDHTLEVVSIGAETSEAAILDWIKETIKVMREARSTDVQAADMYDRANLKPLN